MQRITINIPNTDTASKILWMLQHFTNEGITIENEQASLGQNIIMALEDVNAGKSRPAMDVLNEL